MTSPYFEPLTTDFFSRVFADLRERYSLAYTQERTGHVFFPFRHMDTPSATPGLHLRNVGNNTVAVSCHFLVDDLACLLRNSEKLTCPDALVAAMQSFMDGCELKIAHFQSTHMLMLSGSFGESCNDILQKALNAILRLAGAPLKHPVAKSTFLPPGVYSSSLYDETTGQTSLVHVNVAGDRLSIVIPGHGGASESPDDLNAVAVLEAWDGELLFCTYFDPTTTAPDRTLHVSDVRNNTMAKDRPAYDATP